MKRHITDPRPNWQELVEGQGLLFHTVEESVEEHSAGYRDAPHLETRSRTRAYWSEDAYYAFDGAEVDSIEAATNALQAMCLQAAQHVIDEGLYGRLGIPEAAIPLIETSWNEEVPAVYGRMDLAYVEGQPPRLLEYNADTPTSLLEAAVIQWTWLEGRMKGADQFNSIHERLVAKWKELRSFLHGGGLLHAPRVHFAHLPNVEDAMTIAYLQDTAHQAGLRTEALPMRDIRWHEGKERFCDAEDRPIDNLFKLYPWEWLLADEFGQHVPRAKETFWMEPAWKMLLSNKGILAVLWELFPDHPNLLEARVDEGGEVATGWVKKPLLSREGANVLVVTNEGVRQETGGPYTGPSIVQRFVDIPEVGGYRPVLGSWVIDGEAAGMGIRETPGYVTDNTARFVPHVLR